uniref:Uncharacterized protein n=1 Tax=Cannabis sativa TaxID=3483 RepID=A0A803QS48_CANSA
MYSLSGSRSCRHISTKSPDAMGSTEEENVHGIQEKSLLDWGFEYGLRLHDRCSNASNRFPAFYLDRPLRSWVVSTIEHKELRRLS